MKKNIFFVAIAALALCFASCQKETINPVNTPNDNGGMVNPNARVKTTSDLNNTDWTCSMTFNQILFLMGADTTCIPSFGDETYDMGLSFGDSLANFTFPENIEAYNADVNGMAQIFGLSYQYSYNGATHTGYFVCNAEDDNGNVVPTQLQFTYDDATDVITFNIELYYATEDPDDFDDTNPIIFPLNFARNE